LLIWFPIVVEVDADAAMTKLNTPWNHDKAAIPNYVGANISVQLDAGEIRHTTMQLDDQGCHVLNGIHISTVRCWGVGSVAAIARKVDHKRIIIYRLLAIYMHVPIDFTLEYQFYFFELLNSWFILSGSSPKIDEERNE
jgi:hypothetical protein